MAFKISCFYSSQNIVQFTYPLTESTLPFREKGCNVRGQQCPIHLLKVNVILALRECGKSQGTKFKLRNPYYYKVIRHTLVKYTDHEP